MGQGGALRFVLGDQLSRDLSSLADLDIDRDTVLMVEVADETRYVQHHPKKIALILSAMRHFAERLRAEGVAVDYVRLDQPGNSGSFLGELVRAVARHKPDRIVVTEPGEWRVLADMLSWQEATGTPVELREDTRFLCSTARFRDHASGRKQLRMEFFYREMRRATGLLMEGDQPAGGAWNFDAENRKKLPKSVKPPPAFRIEPDAITRGVLDLVRARFADHFGQLDGFCFAVTREDASRAFGHFLTYGLAQFGDYQDAMADGEDYLFHAVISPYLNIGLLDPLTVCRQVEAAWRAGRAPLNAAEGFIRQILGWREFVRGIYWLKMPDYAGSNHLNAKRALPDFYWSADTDMNCLRRAIDQTRRLAYAHHIQRLMVTGNFALLIGADPAQVEEWYLAVYADAFEWVELPNTHGMVLHADGGYLGSKPYAASGKYIDRMSDYCRSCRFDVAETTGPNACPFNFLYWNFLIEHEARFRPNMRMKMMYASLDRMAGDKRAAIREQALAFLDRVAPLPGDVDA
jgi:deoxyribodipyrimidine photolyase-related protein